MNPTPNTNTNTKPAPSEEPIRVDGFGQVLAMLRVADPKFRESLLNRIEARDKHLAEQLRADLENF